MARSQHLDELTIDTPDWLDRHIRRHPVHGGDLRRKRLLLLPVRHILPSVTDMVSLRRDLRRHERYCPDRSRGRRRDYAFADKGAREQNQLYPPNAVRRYVRGFFHGPAFPFPRYLGRGYTPTKRPAAD